MTKLLNQLKRHPLAAFVILAYACSWLLWRIAPGSGSAAPFITWLGDFGPAMAAIFLTALLGGSSGLRDLLAQAQAWKVSPRWYLAALGLPVVGMLALIGMAWISGANRDSAVLQAWGTGLLRHAGILGLTLLLGLVVVAGEEFGWRGFVLPQLQTHHTDLSASLLVGLVWGLWHLPNLWPFNPGQEPLDLLLFMADIVTISIVYTWLYTNSRRNLLLVSLFHASYDLNVIYASATLPFLHATRGYELIVVLVIAGMILLRHGPARFTRLPHTPDQLPTARPSPLAETEGEFGR